MNLRTSHVPSLLISGLVLLLCGCRQNGGPEESGQKFNPPSKKAKTLIGYALPWDWHRPENDPLTLANALYSAGCTATLIEIDERATPDFVASWIKPFRERGIVVEIVLVNANSSWSLNQSSSWFENYVRELRQKVGTQGVIFQPVCEPGNKGGDKKKLQHWMNYGFKNWPGVTAVNLEFKWAKPFLNQATYLEKHWCEDFSERNILRGEKHINTTDCSPMINIPAERIYHLTKTAIKTESNFIYYHADWTGPQRMDLEKIKAIEKAIQES